MGGEVPSLLCDGVAAAVGRVAATVDRAGDAAWYQLLEKGHQGWGWQDLARDILAEQFVTKVRSRKC